MQSVLREFMRFHFGGFHESFKELRRGYRGILENFRCLHRRLVRFSEGFVEKALHLNIGFIGVSLQIQQRSSMGL